MAAETSPTTGRRYGIAQVCRVWEVARSSFYADRRRADRTTPVPAQRRGPKPVISDDALLAAIRADLARSPWHGEGHRKVWLFGVIEHWNAEALGWHVAKRGDRYAAVQAVGMAMRNVFGHVSPSAARGLALRHDHGSAFLADHFHNQIRFWGMTPSYAFVGEPETNGVIERFFRTLKEQIVHGRIYQTIDQVRDAVRDFVARYNTDWLIEKNGLRSPSDARAAWSQAVMSAAA